MANKLGVSGSTIMTDMSELDKLFQWKLPHIEIGEFSDEAAFEMFIHSVQAKEITFGIHSPLHRNESKYDLLENVQFEPEQAWSQFETEVERMSRLGAEYVLVHFPYFKQGPITNARRRIEEGLAKLSRLQTKYEIPIVCEPKLGLNRSRVGIDALNDFPEEIWEKYGLKLCIDIGDYVMAVGDDAIDYISKWKSYIKVVHLHNVEFPDNKYIWVPVHPSHEHDGAHYKIQGIIRFLSTCEDVFFVLEHTPHSNPSDMFVEEGIQWIRKLIQE